MEGKPGPESVTIEIDLASLWVGGENGTTFAEHVASLAAQKLMRGDEARDLRRRAMQIADEEIREQLRPVVADAIEAAVQRTDTFGSPRGEAKTLREVIVQEATDQLKKPQGDGFGGTRRGETLVQSIIRNEVSVALTTDLKAAVASARTEVLAAVSEKASEVIAETIARTARV